MNYAVPISFLFEVATILEDHQLFHSDFQIDCFITSRAGDFHPWGMYVQCLRELHTRRATLIDLQNSLDENAISKEECELDATKWRWNFWTRRSKLRSRRTAIKLNRFRESEMQLKNQLRHAYREAKRFKEQADSLRQVVGGSLDEDKRQHLDREYWLHKLKIKVCSSVLATGRSPVDILEMLPGLPQVIRGPLGLFLREVCTPEAAKEYLDHIVGVRPNMLGLSE